MAEDRWRNTPSGHGARMKEIRRRAAADSRACTWPVTRMRESGCPIACAPDARQRKYRAYNAHVHHSQRRADAEPPCVSMRTGGLRSTKKHFGQRRSTGRSGSHPTAARRARATGRRSSNRRAPRWPPSRAKPFDLVFIDMNYSRDTTSGEEGLALLEKLLAQDADLAGDRDDRLVERRPRGGRDAPRRGRLYSEAVGQRACCWRRSRSRPNRSKERKKGQQRARNRAARAAAPAAPARASAEDRRVRADVACPRAKSAAITTIFSSSAPGRLGVLLADVSGKGVAARAADGESAGVVPQPARNRREASQGAADIGE